MEEEIAEFNIGRRKGERERGRGGGTVFHVAAFSLALTLSIAEYQVRAEEYVCVHSVGPREFLDPLRDAHAAAVDVLAPFGKNSAPILSNSTTLHVICSTAADVQYSCY